jgi:hypothetical protein
MAELTNLEDKLGEVIGLAMAGQAASAKVAKLARAEDEALAKKLEQVVEEAKETEERGTELAGSLDGKKTAILEKARETKQKASEMMDTYLDEDADALDGFEFLTMAEAAEVGHWTVLEAMGGRRQGFSELVAWALPIQKRHFDDALAGSKKLAAEEDPDEES